MVLSGRATPYLAASANRVLHRPNGRCLTDTTWLGCAELRSKGAPINHAIHRVEAQNYVLYVVCHMRRCC